MGNSLVCLVKLRIVVFRVAEIGLLLCWPIFQHSLLHLFLYLGCSAYSNVLNLYTKDGGISTGINVCVPSGVAHWQPRST